MMPHTVVRLDDDEVEPQRQPWDWLAAWKGPAIEEAVRRCPDPRPLPMVDGLLGQAEAPAGAPADLDDDKRRGRTRVDRHEIEFMATDMDVPGQDGPTSFREPRRDQRFGGITRLLGRRPGRVVGSVRHAGIVAADP